MADQKRPREEDLPKFDDPTDLINAVISTLQAPEERTNVSTTYANDKNLATEVQAYAKIAGRDWTFYVKALAISIGRNTDNIPGAAPPAQQVDIDLGPAKVVSRQHAVITYNIDLRCWELKVLGRNGARVDGTKIAVGSQHSTPLHSGAILDIGGTQMMFILPDAPPSILQKMLNVCLARYKPDSNKLSRTSSMSSASGVMSNNASHGMSQFSSISSFQMFDKTNLNHSPSAVSAVSLQNNLDQDLSREDAKDIKPPYSYATMITQAILSNPEGVMSLSEIYGWISSHYAYYKYSKTGWQNSIRHNLSLNKAFEKVPRRPNEPGKGMKWQISDSYKQDFMKKIQSGTLLKSRRGSSVSRTLQIHLATHSQLPDSQNYFKSEDHSRSNSFDHRHAMSIDQIPNASQKAPLPYVGLPPGQPQASVSNGYPIPYGTPYQATGAPPSMHGQASQPLHLNPPYIPTHGEKTTELASPLRHTRLDQNLPKLPKVNGNSYYSLPQPTSNGHHVPTSSMVPDVNIYKPNTQHTQDLEADHGGPVSFSNSSNPTNTSESMQNSTAPTATNTSDLALGFTSPKKIAPLEAFTPERGSKVSGQRGRGFNGNAQQSSPALWNFVQFSTPNGQTPGRKDSEFSNGQTSPAFSKGGNSIKRSIEENDSPTNVSPQRDNLSE